MTEADFERNRQLNYLLRTMETITSVVTRRLNSGDLTSLQEAEVLASGGKAAEGLLGLHRAISAHQSEKLMEMESK